MQKYNQLNYLVVLLKLLFCMAWKGSWARRVGKTLDFKRRAQLTTEFWDELRKLNEYITYGEMDMQLE